MYIIKIDHHFDYGNFTSQDLSISTVTCHIDRYTERKTCCCEVCAACIYNAQLHI